MALNGGASALGAAAFIVTGTVSR